MALYTAYCFYRTPTSDTNRWFRFCGDGSEVSPDSPSVRRRSASVLRQLEASQL
jgi:hypothetical protein